VLVASLNPNFILCDLLSRGTSHYLKVLSVPETGRSIRLPPYIEPLLLDDEAVVASLKSFGLLRVDAALSGQTPGIEVYKDQWLKIATTLATKPGNEDLLAELQH
jgi:hypothetical protein